MMKNTLLNTINLYKDLGDRALRTIFFKESEAEYLVQKNLITILLKNLNKLVVGNSKNLYEIEEQSSINSTAEKSQNSHTEITKLWEQTCKHLIKEVENLDVELHQKKSTEKEDETHQAAYFLSQVAQFSYYVGQIVSVLGNKFQNTIPNDSTRNNNISPENSSPVCFAKSDEVRDDYKI